METSTETKKEGEKMSKTKDNMQNFLDEVGYSLGYDEKNLPTLQDIDIIWANRVHVW